MTEELPDLDESQIGVIAFWNAMENGADEVEPMEITEYDPLQSYELYSNGVEGKVPYSYEKKDMEFDFRVKTDGWHMVWVRRQNDFVADYPASDADDYYGYWDIINDWTDPSSNSDMLPDGVLGHLINEIASYTAPQGVVSTVGYYCMEYPDANSIWQADHQTHGEIDSGLSYTSDISRYYHAVFGVHRDNTNEPLTFGGETVANDTDYTPHLGALDAIKEGLMDNSTEIVRNESGDVSRAKIGHLVMYEV